MKRGYSLIELVVVVGIITLLLTIASLSIGRIKERRAIVESRDKISGILTGYFEDSYNTGKTYEIKFDYGDKRIEVRDGEGVVEELGLSKILEYTTIYDAEKQAAYQTTTNTRGGSDKSFSIYIFGMSSKAWYRISVDNAGNPSGRGYVNIYRNIDSQIDYSNVEVEHYNFNYNRWEKE